MLRTITIVSALLFPASVAVGQEKEDKDAIIKMLKDKLQRVQREADLRQQELDLKLKAARAEIELQKLMLALQQARIDKRQAQQIALLEKVIAEREALIVRLEADLNVAKVQGMNFEALAEARGTQNENLLRQLRDLLTKQKPLAESELNPPKADVKGRIERVDDKDPSLVQINLGTDNGIAKNHTLYLYRTKPELTHVGYVRIIEARHQKAVGQVIKIGDARPSAKVDDMVASKLPKGLEPKVFELNDPSTQNPPPAVVTGKIEKIDAKDASLVKISLGSDHGIKEGHTLDVYRTKPEPKYLGIIRIVSVENTSAVARFVASGNAANRPMLKEGDMVTSKLR